MYQNGTKGYETPTEGGNNVSEQNQPKKQDYSCYDKMSTEELEEILHLDFLASEDGESDLDAILYISDLLAQRTQLSNTEAAWEQFQTEYRPYADGQSLYEFDCDRETSEKEPISTVPTPCRRRRVVYLRRVGVLVAALIACMLGGVVMAQAMGLNLFHVLAQWTDETFQFVNAASTASQTRTEMSQELQFFLQEFRILRIVLFLIRAQEFFQRVFRGRGRVLSGGGVPNAFFPRCRCLLPRQIRNPRGTGGAFQDLARLLPSVHDGFLFQKAGF